MTDPTDGFVSFQEALLEGKIDLSPGAIHRDVYVHHDEPAEHVHRMTYVQLTSKRKVKALAMAVAAEPYEGLPCFQLGVAVPEQYRGKGLAKRITKAAIDELKNGMASNGIKSFYVEAVVNVDNAPSNRVARAVISTKPKEITDEQSGLPALQYMRKV